MNSVLRLNMTLPGLDPDRLSGDVRGVARHGRVRRRVGLHRGDHRRAPRRRRRVDARDARVHRHARRPHDDDRGRGAGVAAAAARPVARRGRPRRPRSREWWTGRGDARRRLPTRGVRGARQELGRPRQADGRSGRGVARRVDGRAVRLPRHACARDARPAYEAASADHDRGQRASGCASRGAVRPAVRAARVPAGARGLLLRAVRGARHDRLRRVTATRSRARVRERRSRQVVGGDRPVLPARGDHLRRMADARHQVVGALARHHRRRAPRRGHLRDPHARAVPRAGASRAATTA